MTLKPMNVLIFVTDQQRKMDYLKTWEADHLEGMDRLRKQGLSFENAFTNACMCSPARATMLSGYFPAQHGVKYTLEQDMDRPAYPQSPFPLPDQMQNIASVMSQAGYDVVYKGKFHLAKYPQDRDGYIPEDVGQYGFKRWNPQDAGANQDPPEAGGGTANNDGRFMDDDGPMEAGEEGVLSYLAKVANGEDGTKTPFCLIVSLVNPHDVLFYPRALRTKDVGYQEDHWLQGDVRPPSTVDESLESKPSVQQEFLELCNTGMGPILGKQQQNEYVNFYGNLLQLVDGYLVHVLDALDAHGLTDDTLVIRTTDHGEMGLAHGGQRQKNFNFYEESINVPLIYSNPTLFPEPRTSKALVSHVDLLPTLASLFDAPADPQWQGVDYAQLVLDESAPPVQDYVVFTYDDYQSGQTLPPNQYPSPPNHIVSIREDRYKLAEYYDPAGKEDSQWEMYDLEADPHERDNLTAPGVERTEEQQAAYDRLRVRLDEVKQTRLEPLS